MEIRLLEKREKENNREYAYRTVRENIMTLALAPGETLNENELADQMKVSRTPVHEAILMLKEEALAEVYPQSGSKVARLDVERLNEGFFLRLQVEPAVLVQIAGNLSSEQIAAFKENLKYQSEAAKCEDGMDELYRLDSEFHHMIYRFSRKETIWRAVRNVCSHYDRVCYLDGKMSHDSAARKEQENRTLYRILLTGQAPDGDLGLFYERHLSAYRRNFGEMLEQYAEYFNI